jgi:hypothetical protein
MRTRSGNKNVITIARNTFWRAMAWLRAQPDAAGAPKTVVLPPCLSTADQWDRVAAILLEAQSRARRAADHQRIAAMQLDAASYALQRLREEIKPALQVTVRQTTRPAAAPTGFRQVPFRRREPIAA